MSIVKILNKNKKNVKRNKKRNYKQKGGNANMCSPAIVTPNTAGTKSYNYSCFTLKDLQEMAKMVNKKYKSDIKINSYNAFDKAKLVRDIHIGLKCGNLSLDMCIAKNYSSDFSNIIKKTLKPKRPRGKEEWLSNIDIYDVMEQYMQKYSDFIFLGPVPIDWQDFSNALSRINLKKLYKNKKKIGIIFNTDPSYKSGEHWISMFIDLINKTICFFDSVGDEPPKEVKIFMRKIIKQANTIGLKLKEIINDKQHQKKSTECGVYSLYFIISRLEGKSCEYINNKIIRDDEMNKYREKFFRPNL